MKSIQKTREEIPKVLFWINLIIFIISLFTFSKTLFLILIILNILFLGSYLIIKKYGIIFEGLLITNRLGNLGKKLNDLGSR